MERISEEKRWEEFVEVARRVRQKRRVKFALKGAAYSQAYFEELRRRAGGDVEFLVDVDEE